MSETAAYNVVVEWEHDCDETFAKNVMQVLLDAYPGHPWHVNVTGGVIVLKHMRVSPKWGMVLHYMKVNGDAERLKHGVLIAGGELLERAGEKRGTFDPHRIRAVEGIPTGHLVI